MKQIVSTLLELHPFTKQCITPAYPKNKYTTRFKYGIRSTMLKPAYVYYIKLEFKGITVWKIGYTSTSIRSRITWMRLEPSVKVTVLASIKMKSSTQAYHLEQLLHKEFKESRYIGSRLLTSGNTELYKVSLT